MTEAMREQFEAWMSKDGKYPQAVERNGFGEYRLMDTYTNWGTWQAALRSPAVVALVEACKGFPENPNPYTYRMAHAKLRDALAPFTTGAGHE